jgi:hypothetical protein
VPRGENLSVPNCVLQKRCWYFGTRLQNPDFSSTSWRFMRPSTTACTSRSSSAIIRASAAIAARRAVSSMGAGAATGSGTDVAIKTKTITSQPNAVGDNAFLHVTREEIAAAAANAGYEVVGISASCTVATNTDEAVVTYICLNGRRQYAGQTADIIA